MPAAAVVSGDKASQRVMLSGVPGWRGRHGTQPGNRVAVPVMFLTATDWPVFVHGGFIMMSDSPTPLRHAPNDSQFSNRVHILKKADLTEEAATAHD